MVRLYFIRLSNGNGIYFYSKRMALSYYNSFIDMITISFNESHRINGQYSPIENHGSTFYPYK